MRPEHKRSLHLFPEKFHEILSIRNEKSFSIRRDRHHFPNLRPIREGLARMIHLLLFIVSYPHKSNLQATGNLLDLGSRAIPYRFRNCPADDLDQQIPHPFDIFDRNPIVLIESLVCETRKLHPSEKQNYDENRQFPARMLLCYTSALLFPGISRWQPCNRSLRVKQPHHQSARRLRQEKSRSHFTKNLAFGTASPKTPLPWPAKPASPKPDRPSPSALK